MIAALICATSDFAAVRCYSPLPQRACRDKIVFMPFLHLIFAFSFILCFYLPVRVLSGRAISSAAFASLRSHAGVSSMASRISTLLCCGICRGELTVRYQPKSAYDAAALPALLARAAAASRSLLAMPKLMAPMIPACIRHFRLLDYF